MESSISRPRAIAALVLVLTLVAGACGDDDLSRSASDGSGDGSRTENALCPLDDIVSPPPDLPFMKPPSLNALAYDGPDQLGSGVYELRGVTFEPDAVVGELMTVVFPDADFTQVSAGPDQEAYDFIDPAGLGGYVSITVICASVAITLRLLGGAVETEG